MEILNLREHRELVCRAAAWFHEKWGVPAGTYAESMESCLKNQTGVPQWYVAVVNGQIVAGIGVIENDFHNRRDLAPNVCALYVEEAWRGRGIAGRLLEYVCVDMARMGIDPLYLITDHTAFYERCGWEFLCMVQAEGEPEQMRMYIRWTK